MRRRALRGQSMARRKEPLLEKEKHSIKAKAERTLPKEEDPHPLKQPGEGFESTRLLFWEMEESENQVS